MAADDGCSRQVMWRGHSSTGAGVEQAGGADITGFVRYVAGHAEESGLPEHLRSWVVWECEGGDGALLTSCAGGHVYV